MEVLINQCIQPYVNVQKNFLICLHGNFYNDIAKFKTRTSDQMKNHVQLIVLIEGHRQWWDLVHNCWQHSECYDEASLILHMLIMTLSPVLTSSPYPQVTCDHPTPGFIAGHGGWGVQSEVLVIWLQPSLLLR